MTLGYRCEYCGHELRPDDKGVGKFLSGWLKNGSTSIRFTGPVTRYAHWVCVETGQGRGNPDDQPALF